MTTKKSAQPSGGQAGENGEGEQPEKPVEATQKTKGAEATAKGETVGQPVLQKDDPTAHVYEFDVVHTDSEEATVKGENIGKPTPPSPHQTKHDPNKNDT